MKSNFKNNSETKFDTTPKSKDLSQDDFEKFMSESGASGSFMIYRSKNKDHEMGLDEL